MRERKANDEEHRARIGWVAVDRVTSVLDEFMVWVSGELESEDSLERGSSLGGCKSRKLQKGITTWMIQWNSAIRNPNGNREGRFD